MKKFDYLVVGSGLYGAIFAHEAKAHGKSVLVVDKRCNIAGNIYTEKIEGINVHPKDWKDSFGLSVEEHKKALETNLTDGYIEFSATR